MYPLFRLLVCSVLFVYFCLFCFVSFRSFSPLTTMKTTSPLLMILMMRTIIDMKKRANLWGWTDLLSCSCSSFFSLVWHVFGASATYSASPLLVPFFWLSKFAIGYMPLMALACSPYPPPPCSLKLFIPVSALNYYLPLSLCL